MALIHLRFLAACRQVRWFAVAAALACAGAALGQTPQPAYLPEGLKLGFGMLPDRILEGMILESKPNIGSAEACATECSGSPICRSFTYVVGPKICEFKGNNTFQAQGYIGYVSGISLPARDFKLADQPTTGQKRVKAPYFSKAQPSNASNLNTCAAACQDFALEKRCRAFTLVPPEPGTSVSVCNMSETAELQDGAPLGSVTMVPVANRDDFVIADLKILEGAITRSTQNVEKLDDCAALCKADGTCNSFTFIPSMRICEFKNDHRFSPKAYAGYVSGVKKEFRMRVQGVYLVPRGQSARPNAVAAIEAALRVVQEHFGRELGRTFVLETPAVTVVNTDKLPSDFAADHSTSTPSGAINPDAPPPDTPIVTFAKDQFGEDYILRKNLIVLVIEGLQGAGYGGVGLAVIPTFMWDDVYKNYADASMLLKAKNFAGWTHEIGHAFGLFHWDLNECLSKPLTAQASAIMWQQSTRPTLFDYYFAEWEKARLRGENVNVGRYCSQRYPATVNNLRPGSEGYLRMEYVPKI
jgi:hypothetical protein